LTNKLNLKINWSSHEKTMFILKKPVASKCVILCKECAKTHVRASINSKFFRELYRRSPVENGREGRELGGEGRDGDGWEEGMGRVETGKEGWG
jgi:hypothetical protein